MLCLFRNIAHTSVPFCTQGLSFLHSKTCSLTWDSTCSFGVSGLQGRCSKDSNQRSVIITITDVCPECATDHIDMQALTFNKVRPLPHLQPSAAFSWTSKLCFVAFCQGFLQGTMWASEFSRTLPL